MSNFDVEVGKRAEHIRHVLSMSQKEVAERIGVTRQTMGNYESGKTPMRASTVRALCDIYKCSAEWMLGSCETLTVNRRIDGRTIQLREDWPKIPRADVLESEEAIA